MRRICLLLTIFVAALAAVSPAVAQDGTYVASGVTVDGVDLSGLTNAEVRTKVEQELIPQLASKVVVRVGSREFTLPVSKAKRVYYVSGIATRALAAAPGTAIASEVAVSASAVTAWVDSVAASVRVNPRDAKLTIKIKKMKVTKSRPGKRISNASVVAAVTKAFTLAGQPSTITPRLLSATPKTTVKDLRKQYSTVLTVSQSKFRVHLFKHLKLVKTFPIAVGSPAHPTPKGRFKILDKAVNPTWNVPNSPWAGELQGTTVDGGSAQNPLKARWMGIGNGIGFHGTGEDYSIGSRASHGCMRMHVKDVIALYPRVPVGTTVVIK
jgi:lipoprotein-anchoring transpeptidase ErfK/SrfK